MYCFDNINTYDFIDVHYHVSPDLYNRRYNVIQAGEIYRQCKGAVVLKSHLGSTVQSAVIAQDLGLPVFPSVVLNNIAGGASIKVIKHALAEYNSHIKLRLLVHLPTLTNNKTHKPKVERKFYNNYSSTVKTPEIISYKNKLKPNIIDVLKFAKDNPIIISTGHSSYNEVMLLLEACDAIGLNKIMLNQPDNPMVGFTYQQLKEIVSSKVWIEQTALTYKLGYQNWNNFSSVLKDLSNVIYSSDYGQLSQPSISEWRIESNEWFMKINLCKKQIKDIQLNNVINLLKE